MAFLGTVIRPGRSVEELRDDQDLVAEGFMDSLGVIEIILHLELQHGVNIRPGEVELSVLTTVGGLLRLIEEAG